MTMDAKLKDTINMVLRLCNENAEFGSELRKQLGLDVQKKILSADGEHIEQIYEYCIERVVKHQAEEFYSDFPIKDIIPVLVQDFCRMECFRRKDCFGDFCLALYQQLECIANTLCLNPDLCEIAEHMWGYPAYVKTGKDITPTIENRVEGDYSIAALVFPGRNSKTGRSYAYEKSMMALQSLYAMDKIRSIVYFVGYKSAMRNSDYDEYVTHTSLLSDIYMCRNTNHRGNALKTWEQKTIDRVLPQKSVYYFKFLGALTQFVEYVKTGLVELPTMRQYAQRLPKKAIKEDALKIIGTIDLRDDGRKGIRVVARPGFVVS